MAHTRAARYLRKRLRSLLRRLTPCCVRSQPSDGGGGRQARGVDPGVQPEIIASSPEKGADAKAAALAWDPGAREQLLASFVSNYVKEIIFNAKVKLYIEDMIIKGSLAIIGSMLPARNEEKIS